MPSLADLKTEISAQYSSNPQLSWYLNSVIESVKAGLETLARHGHLYDLIEGTAKPPEEFPKMMYHQTIGALGVENQADQEALGPGWQEKPFGGPEAPVVVDEPLVAPAPVTVDIAAWVAGQDAHVETNPAADSEQS